MITLVIERSATQERALDAALGLVARWGITKTTLGDVARAAGMSRATLYRAFPGGKDELFGLLAQREAAGIFDQVMSAVDAAADLPSALTSALHATAVQIYGHAAVRFVLEHEPELAVPVLGFDELDRLLRVVRHAAAPHLVRFLTAEQAGWAAEWLVRVFISALVNPTAEFDLTDRDVCERLVCRYVVPAFTASTISLESQSEPDDLTLVSQ